jgi:hypothetical protein
VGTPAGVTPGIGISYQRRQPLLIVVDFSASLSLQQEQQVSMFAEHILANARCLRLRHQVFGLPLFFHPREAIKSCRLFKIYTRFGQPFFVSVVCQLTFSQTWTSLASHPFFRGDSIRPPRLIRTAA